MKTIVKVAALAMTLSLAFVLTACGGSASSSAASSSASASASSASASAASPSASAASASASAASASASSASAVTDADTYTNEFFGLQFNLPAGWSFVDTAALTQANDAIAAASQGSEIDMVAMNAEKNQIVVVGVEAASEKTAGKTVEQYLEAEGEDLKVSLGNNYSLTSTTGEVTFEGIERTLPATITTVDVNGVQLVIGQTAAEKDGSFFNAIAMGSSQEEVATALGCFSSAVE